MIETVSFDCDGDRIVGHLHLAAGGGVGAAVIVAGPMTSVKEQVTGVYAAALADRGIAALAIDHRGYGESGGTPRQYEHWQRKVADLTRAIDVLAEHPRVDPARIGAVGVCLGAGYAAWTAVGDTRIRAFGGVVGYYRDPDAMRAADPAGFAERVAEGRAARVHFETTGDVITIPAVARAGDAAMTTPELNDYYGTPRAGVANYVNAFAVMSREMFLPFDVQAAAPKLTVPTVMIHSESALSPQWARKFHDAIAAPKALHWLEGTGQVDFYDNPVLVAAAADVLAGHFEGYLCG